MPIKNFPERVFRTNKNVADALAGLHTKIDSYSYTKDITATALDQTLYISQNNTFSDLYGYNWRVHEILFSFSNTTQRNFYAKIKNGAYIVTNYNDTLWFQTPNSLWQEITLTAGFYTGTLLAAQLQTQLNANAAFTALGLTFTVAYNTTTGVFSITPSSGTLKYIQTNNTQVMGKRDSIAGHLFGLTTDTSFAASVSSDTPVYGLDTETAVVSQTSDSSTSFSYTTPLTLTLDQAIHFTTNTAATIVTVKAIYETLP